MTPVWFFVCIAGATPNAPLATAEDLVANVRYADAEKPLAQARAVPDNGRDTLLRILELQGVVAATLNNPQKARAFFQQLLTLDPERKLPEGQPPRVRTPFYEAKGMVSEGAPMQFTGSVKTTADGVQLEGHLSADPQSLAKKTRFHFREAGSGGAWVVKESPLVNGVAAHAPGRGRYEWFVELLGDADAQLFLVGSEAKPFVDGPTQTVAQAAPSDVTKPAPAPAASGGSRTGPLFWTCVAGTGAAAIGGAVAGVLSKGGFDSIGNATKDARGVVTGMTQKQADQVRATAKTEALAANVLFGVAGAFAATGLVVFLVSGPSSSAAIVPAPNGLAVAGSF